MTVFDIVFNTLIDVNIRVIDNKSGDELVVGTSVYINNYYPTLLTKKVCSIDINNNDMIIRVRDRHKGE